MKEKLFSALIVLFPIFSLYGIYLGAVTLADLLLLIISIPLYYTLLKNRVTIKAFISPLFLIYSIYIIIQFFFVAADSRNWSDMLFRTLRYAYYTITIALLIKNFFLFEYAEKIYKIVAFFSVIFIIIQTLSFLLGGYYIQGYVPFLPVMRTELVDFSQNIGLDGGDTRPRSIFGEPAHYSQFVLGYLSILLFSSKTSKWTFLGAIFLTFGLLLSVSSTGILGAFFIWLIWGVREIRKIKYNNVFYLLVLVPILYACYQLPFFQFFLERMEAGSSSSGRFSGYSYLMNDVNYTLSEVFWGHGMQLSFDKYLPGFANIYWYFGLVGLSIFMLTILVAFAEGITKQKIILLIFLFLNLGTEIAVGPFLLLYMSFVLTKSVRV